MGHFLRSCKNSLLIWQKEKLSSFRNWLLFNWNNEITKQNVWAGLMVNTRFISLFIPPAPFTKIPGCCWVVFSRLWRENVSFSTGRPLPRNTIRTINISTTKCKRERIFRIRWMETFTAQDGKGKWYANYYRIDHDANYFCLVGRDLC